MLIPDFASTFPLDNNKLTKNQFYIEILKWDFVPKQTLKNSGFELYFGTTFRVLLAPERILWSLSRDQCDHMMEYKIAKV